MSLRDFSDELDRITEKAERAAAAVAAIQVRPTPAGLVAAVRASLTEVSAETDIERVREWVDAVTEAQLILAGWAAAMAGEPLPDFSVEAAPGSGPEITPPPEVSA